MTTLLNFTEELLYPEDDGNPMSESTEQYRWIVVIKENLELLLLDRPDVFVAADLAWYPEQVKAPPAPCQAPDVMVIFGQPKGPRRSYMQWKENGTAPQVVFEILSDSNKTGRGIEGMKSKFQFYQQHGVEEYYIYDPYEFTLEGWQREGTWLVAIAQMSNWVSPLLGIRFKWEPSLELTLCYPDGRAFSSFVELDQEVETERARTEQERSKAEQERSRADQAELQVETERSRADQAQTLAKQAQARADQAEQTIRSSVGRLLGLGLTVEQVAEALGLAIEDVMAET